MSTSIGQAAFARKPKKNKLYASEFEKQLMVDNLRSAVEIYGKDWLRDGFKVFKNKNPAKMF
ncbi:MAG: hypothetical protein H8E32_08720 [Nitrospinae bacterium]|nr:hypothetical protein [Nitrospinota bacterium]